MIGLVKKFRLRQLFKTRRAVRQFKPSVLDSLETRALLASLAPIATQTVGAGIGLPVVLNNTTSASETFTATSSNLWNCATQQELSPDRPWICGSGRLTNW